MHELRINRMRKIRNKYLLLSVKISAHSVITQNWQTKNRKCEKLISESYNWPIWIYLFSWISVILLQIHTDLNFEQGTRAFSLSQIGMMSKLTDNFVTLMIAQRTVSKHHQIIPHQWANYSLWRVCTRFQIETTKMRHRITLCCWLCHRNPQMLD